MANIIRFPAEAAKWRDKPRATSHSSQSKRGEIVIFTGVRYSRDDDDRKVHNGGNASGKRKRRAKAS